MTYEEKTKVIKKIIDDTKYFRSTSTKWLKEESENKVNCLEEILEDLYVLGLYSNYYIINEPKDGYKDKAIIKIDCEDGAFKSIQQWEHNHFNILNDID